MCISPAKYAHVESPPQVLVDDERYELLTRESKRIGAPVGELVRRAIDHEFPRLAGRTERERAGRDLLAMSPPTSSGKELDWEQQKPVVRNAPMEKWPGAVRHFLYDVSVFV